MIGSKQNMNFTSSYENIEQELTMMLEQILILDQSDEEKPSTSASTQKSYNENEEYDEKQFYAQFEYVGKKTSPRHPEQSESNSSHKKYEMLTKDLNETNPEHFLSEDIICEINSAVTNQPDHSIGTKKKNPLAQTIKLGQEQNYPQSISENFYNTFEGKFIYLIKNYNGSKLLQKSLPNSGAKIITKLFFEIMRNISELMIDPYGNYFCQKFYMLLSLDEKLLFLKEIQNNILPISSNSFGNYSLQAIIEKFTSDHEIEIISKILQNRSTLVNMLRENNSIHVLEKIIMFIPEEKIQLFYEFSIENFVFLATNQNGLSILKKIILCARNYMTQIRIQNLIIINFNMLIQHSFGNHVIQIVVEVINFKLF